MLVSARQHCENIEQILCEACDVARCILDQFKSGAVGDVVNLLHLYEVVQGAMVLRQHFQFFEFFCIGITLQARNHFH